MIERNRKFYVDKIEPIVCNGVDMGFILHYQGSYEKPFKTIPTKGKHDYKTCKTCQDSYKPLVENYRKKFFGFDDKKPFPYCCPEHSKLIECKDFSIEHFKDYPNDVANKVIYTINHIKNNIHSVNYFQEITDYIDYTIESFGVFPLKNVRPLFLENYIRIMIHIFEKEFDFKPKQRERLKNYIFQNYDRNTKSNKTDINILISCYEKWLKYFPFELSFFSNIKKHFENKLPPLHDGKFIINKYLGYATAKGHTKESLIEYLETITDKIISNINTHSLFKSGQLKEPNKIKLELILSERQLKLKKGYLNSQNDIEKGYRKILKKWLSDEKKFISEITPILKNVNNLEQSSTIAITKPELLEMRNNLIVDVELKDVYEYFKVLENTPNKNDKFYLTEQKLLTFIKSTFVDLKPIKQNFDVKFIQDKKNVRSVFRKFELECLKFEKNQSKSKEKYFNIMYDSFKGFDYKTDRNKWHVTNNKIPTKNIKKAK